MRATRLRKRSGHDARLIRLLSRGGIAQRTATGDWQVWQGRDRRTRVAGCLTAAKAAGLFADGSLILTGPGQDLAVWSGDAIAMPDISAPMPTPAITPGRAGRRRPQTYISRLLAASGDADQQRRLMLAASRYAGDVERIATPRRITMAWDVVAVQGGRARNMDGASASAISASRRLEVARSHLPALYQSCLNGVLIYDLSGPAMAQRLGMLQAATDAMMIKALAALADIYDSDVPRQR